MFDRIRARVAMAWTQVTHLGVDPTKRYEARIVAGANQFYVVASIASIPWIIALAVIGGPTPLPAITHTAMVLTWVGGLALNKLAMPLLASTLAILAPIFEYVYLADVYSQSAAFQLSLVAVPALSFVMIPARRWPIRVGLGIAGAIALVVVYSMESFIEPTGDVSYAVVRGLSIANVLTVLITLTTIAAFNNYYLTRERGRTRALLDEAQEAARTDSLTEALNRRGIAPVIAQASRGGQYALALIDLDRFKRINDALGHGAGDVVLANVARTITAELGDRGSVARWGGEEFLVVLPEVSLRDAIAIIDQVRAAVELTYADDGLPEPVTISAGIAHGRRLTSREELLRLADSKLYEAKSSGRNIVVGAAHGVQAAP